MPGRVLERLGDGAGGAGTYVLDSVLARDAALSGGTGLWVKDTPRRM